MNPLFDLEFGPLQEQSEQGFTLRETSSIAFYSPNCLPLKQNHSQGNQTRHGLPQCLRFVIREFQKLYDSGQNILYQVGLAEDLGPGKQLMFRRKFRLLFKCECGRKWVEDNQNVTGIYSFKHRLLQNNQKDNISSDIESGSENTSQQIVKFSLRLSETICSDCCAIVKGEILERDLTNFAKRFCRDVVKEGSKQEKQGEQEDIKSLKRRFGAKTRHF